MTVKRRYELTDEQWTQIEPLLPPYTTGRPASHDRRKMFNAILWVLRSGAPWRDLPEHYGSWKSVYSCFSRWRDRGLLADMFTALSRDADFENLMIDASIVSAHQHSAGAKNGGPIITLGLPAVGKLPKSMR